MTQDATETDRMLMDEAFENAHLHPTGKGLVPREMGRTPAVPSVSDLMAKFNGDDENGYDT